MTNDMDALPNKITVGPLTNAGVNASDGGPVEFPEHVADAWAVVLIGIHEKRQRMADENPKQRAMRK